MKDNKERYPMEADHHCDTRNGGLRIAVIGGGATGVSLLDAIQIEAKYQHLNVDLTLYESDKRIGPGRAYQCDGEYALLNRQARFMSIKEHDPGHFVRWVRENHGAILATQEFLPRHLFGSYLSECFASQLAHAGANGHPIQVIRECATTIHTDNRRVMVGVKKGSTRVYDAAVLCTGTAETSDLYGLSSEPRYIGDPYPMWSTLSGVNSDTHVAIVGSSLTAVDIVLALRAQGHKGRISMLSRRGLLPAVRMPHREFQYKYINMKRLHDLTKPSGDIALSDLIKLITVELSAHGISPRVLAEEFHIRQTASVRLHRHLDQVARGETWLTLLIKMAHDFVEPSWNKLHEIEKLHFMQKHHSLCMSLCNPMPPVTAQTLAAMIDTGQLEIYSGLEAIWANLSDRFTVKTANMRCSADWVVNASRADAGGAGAIGMPIINSMIGSGVAQSHPFGGVHIECGSHRIIRRNGQPNENLYALGQLAAGNLYYTSSLPMITKQIERIVPHLLACYADQTRCAA